MKFKFKFKKRRQRDFDIPQVFKQPRGEQTVEEILAVFPRANRRHVEEYVEIVNAERADKNGQS